jgi:hypothetical protein
VHREEGGLNALLHGDLVAGHVVRHVSTAGRSGTHSWPYDALLASIHLQAWPGGHVAGGWTSYAMLNVRSAAQVSGSAHLLQSGPTTFLLGFVVRLGLGSEVQSMPMSVLLTFPPS